MTSRQGRATWGQLRHRMLRWLLTQWVRPRVRSIPGLRPPIQHRVRTGIEAHWHQVTFPRWDVASYDGLYPPRVLVRQPEPLTLEAIRLPLPKPEAVRTQPTPLLAVATVCGARVAETLTPSVQSVPLGGGLLCRDEPPTLPRPVVSSSDLFRPIEATSPQGGDLTLCAQSLPMHPTRYFLPIVKPPLPLSGLPPARAKQFVVHLARRSQTFPARIQLRRVYPGVCVGAFSSVRADRDGSLLCVPRAEVVGLQRDRLNPPDGVSDPRLDEPTYLVVGLRLDTHEMVRALIPHDALEDPPA